MIHMLLHVLVPLGIALAFFREKWGRSFMILLAGLAIDLDHLLASPIYDPERCSVGFHPLHTTVPIVLFGLLLLHSKTRLLGVGLMVHIALDLIDCKMNVGTWWAG